MTFCYICVTHFACSFEKLVASCVYWLTESVEPAPFEESGKGEPYRYQSSLECLRIIKTILTIAATSLVTFGTPVFAQDSLATAQIKIRYDKMELTTVSGQRDIARRINFAVDRVCGDQVLGTKEEVDMIRDCKQTARGMARAQLPMTVAQRDR